MRFYIAFLIGVLLLTGISSAYISEIEPTRQDACKQIVQIDTQAPMMTLTFVLRPDGSIENIQKPMQSLGNNSFNYTYCNTNLSGTYTANGVSNYSGSEWSYKFKVNMQGKEYNTIDGIIYAIAFIFLLAIGVLGIFAFNVLPFENLRESDNSVIAISWKKYLKIFIGCMLYVVFVAMNYFAWNISIGILQFEELGNFFKFMFRTSFAMMYPLFIIILIWSFAKYVKDKKVEGLIQRNLSFR